MRKPNITLRQICYFIAMAKYTHFGRAADYAGISQPALSVQILELEKRFGQLFVRAGHKVYLTAMGSSLLPKFTEIYDAVMKVENEVFASEEQRMKNIEAEFRKNLHALSAEYKSSINALHDQAEAQGLSKEQFVTLLAETGAAPAQISEKNT